MTTRCAWPGCRLETAASIRAGNKTFQLCDYHGDMVQSENEASMRRARNKLGMEIPTKIRGFVPSMSGMQARARCAYPNCGHPVSLVMYTDNFSEESTHGIPVCQDHWRTIEEDGLKWNSLEWDSVWHKFIPGCGLTPAPLFKKTSPEEKEEMAKIVTEKIWAATEERKERKSIAERLAAGEFDFDPPEE